MDTTDSKLQQIARAESLEDVYRTLSSQPLITPEEIAAFYRTQLNETRGGDKMGRLRLGLQRAYQNKTFFKACVMGHPGVGKSTELSRLVQDIKSPFRTIRFSAMSALNPGNFRPLDVLLLMMIEVTQQTAEVVEPPSPERLQEIWNWFSEKKKTKEQTGLSTAKIEAGGGVKDDSWWVKVSGLFANLRGELRYTASTKTEVVEYSLSNLKSLIDIANRLLDDCNRLLRDADRQEWLFIGEDFDKNGVPTDRVEDLFLNNASIFQDLRTHLIFSVPIGLFYSEKDPQLPFEPSCSLVIPDTPVYLQDHSSNEQGRAAVKEVLNARMNLDLFEPDQMLRLIVASGGNLRDLFGMANYAVDSALLRPPENDKKVNAADVDGALVNWRSDYERRLGQSPYDRQPIPYTEKAKLLKRIYEGEKVAQVPDPVLYSLLSARAVQEFNGQRWFGVHPLVVDILAAQEQLPPSETRGVVDGGTQFS